MASRSVLSTILTGVIVLFVAAMVLGQLLGQPILLGYVTSGSMSPTLEEGDGFIAIPPILAGEFGPGDVVTFDAREIEGGGLTTHRIVDETQEGYITQGDANPFTDQDGDEPPVTENRIEAVAMTFDGEVIRIPALGSIVLAVQDVFLWVIGFLTAIPGVRRLINAGVGTMMVLVGVALVALSFLTGWFKEGRRQTDRSRNREGFVRFSVILLVLLTLILVPLTAGMVVPSGTQDTTIISTQSPTEDPAVIGVGESNEVQYEASNSGFVPRVVMLEPASEGVTISKQRLLVFPGETEGTNVSLHAPQETGSFIRSISERHYAMVLPVSVIAALHDVHPWLAIGSINAFIAGLVTLVVISLIGAQPLRLRSRNRDVSILGRLRQYFR